MNYVEEIMEYGFGITHQQMRVDELITVATAKGYDCTANGTTVKLMNNSGITITVQVIDNGYAIQGTKRPLKCNTIDTAIKTVNGVASKLLAISNKQYE